MKSRLRFISPLLAVLMLLLPILGCSSKINTSQPTEAAATAVNTKQPIQASSAPTDTPSPISTPVLEYQKFLDKAKSGEPINVAFLGGSITAGASYANWGTANTFTGTNIDGTPIDTTKYWSYTDDMRDSWRGRVYNWLKTTYQTKDNQFKQINAAIGGTNSEFGALRLDDHVFSQGIPDIIFIEFAVNDNGRSETQVMQNYESIVNRVKAKNPDCAIFIALSTSRQKSDITNPASYDVFIKSALIAKKYADFKKIPYANIDNAYYHSDLTDAQKTALYYGPKTDAGVHPSPYGYEVYANEVERVLTSCFSTASFTFDYASLTLPAASPAGKIIFGDSILSALPGSTALALADDIRQHKCLSYHKMLYTTSATAELNYTFNGTALWLWMDWGNSNCKIDVYVDDIIILTNWCDTGSQTKLVKNLLQADKPHKVRIVPKGANDTTKPYSFGLRGLIVENYTA